MEIKYMKEALRQAKKAAAVNETPVGAVIVKDGKIIARAYNKRETKKNSLCHAEIIAIDKACKKLGGWRLHGCDLYVTLEPCPMCAGAVIQSRIDRVFFGAYDYKAGCAESKLNLFKENIFNHNVEVTGGVMQEECAALLSDFFKNLRKEKQSPAKAFNPCRQNSTSKATDLLP